MTGLDVLFVMATVFGIVMAFGVAVLTLIGIARWMDL